MNHATACGDVDGDGMLDLFIGTFCDRPAAAYKGAGGPVPSILLLNRGGKFVDSGQAALSWKGRGSGAVLADLDNDGDPDLYVTNNSVRGIFMPNKLFENVGGKFRDVSAGNGACVQMGGRSVGVLDFDGDGLLDLLVCEDVPGHTRVFRNCGGLRFEDATQRAGLPEKLPGLGVATGDLNGDGWPDIFITPANRLFLSRGNGTYREATELHNVLYYKPLDGDPCGAALADVDRDGRLDLAIADHTKRPGAEQHLFLNRGVRSGVPRLQEISKQAGLDYRFPTKNAEGVIIKSAHVELADFDNDGWPDLFVAATWNDGGRTVPFVARNLGRAADGMVRFQAPPAQSVNAYFPAGPVGDYDRDGRLYFSTHRGGASLDKYHYRGDWVLRCDPATGRTEVVVHAPVAKHCIPASVLDPERLTFYGGTAAGNDAAEKRIMFFAYDVRAKRLLTSLPNGCYRYFLLAGSTGRVYYERTDDKGSPTGELMRFDPAQGTPPVKIGKCPGLRAATQETRDGRAYAVSSGQRGTAVLWSLDAKSERLREIGPVAVGSQEYITSIDVDPSGRYLYYVPGAHGGSEADGCPVVQYDLETNRRKVMAFLEPFYREKYGYTPIGSFSSAVDPQGDRLYVTWHGRRRDKGWDTCALTAIRIPEDERQP